jgi:transglutaminase-like putative cysteine protease
MKRFLGPLLVFCAGLAWLRVFPSGALLPILAVGALGPAVLVGLGRRLSLWLLAPLGAAAWLLAASLMLRLPTRLPGLLPAVRDSWYGLLETLPPAPAQPALLAGVHALVWCAGWATAVLLDRARSVLPGLMPGLVVLGLGALYGAGSPGPAVPAAAGYLLAALLLLLADRVRVGTVAVLGAVVVLAAVLGPVPLAGRHPFDPRRLAHQASQPYTGASPLDEVSAWLNTPDQPLFTVDAPRAQNWRIAVLDRFDGRTWRTDDPFLPTGVRVPAATGATTVLTQNVTIEELSGPWLPAAAAPVAVSGLRVLADPATGVLLRRDPVARGGSYRVTSHVARYAPDELAGAIPATDSIARQALGLPSGLPDAIRQAADAATAGAVTPYQQASRLATYLRTVARNDPTAAPGHTYGHVAYFLTVSRRGSSEQFATAFAVLARVLGLPSRVVVGFRSGRPAGTGRWQVEGADALVWPELNFAGLGWVPFYPTPSASAPTGADAPAEGETNQRRQLDQALAAPHVAPDPPSSSVPRRPRHAWPWWPAAAGGGVGFVYLAVVLGVPWARTRRRRRVPDFNERVGTAWCEALALLRWIGLADVTALTAGEVADRATARLGPAAAGCLLPLAELADVAAFSGEPAGPVAARAAWRHRDALASLVFRHIGRFATVRRRLSLRALRG